MRAGWIALLTASAIACAQNYSSNLPLDHPAIHYQQGPLEDPVARLVKRIATGETKLEYREGGLSYLPSLLENLGVNIDSQALVFSKTSFQATRISPRNPRAIYFNDNVAVGWVRGGDGMEIAAVDPKQGVVFYALSTAKPEKPAVARPEFMRKEMCLHCHYNAATLGVPGIFVGSVFPDSAGNPDRQGAIITDHRTPFKDRWGGWYVTATRGEQRDRANAIAPDPSDPQTLQTEGRQNLSSLIREFNTSGYLTQSSDIVALMTFEHQTQMTNLMTRLSWQSRIGAPKSEIDNDVAAIVKYMVFADEAPLREPVEGVSTFTQSFERRGPRDAQGRSLRDFDLRTRLFKYPLSYMIYSAQFDALPDSIRDAIFGKLYVALATAPQGQAIVEILRETKSNLPGYFKRDFTR
jgi:hypothetical protein